MDIRNFVSESLQQIAFGVKDAQQAFHAHGKFAEVNPSVAERGSAKPTGAAAPVEFDLAVTVTEASSDSSAEKLAGKAGFLSVVSMQASGEADSGRNASRSEQQVSRIKFSVMLAQPSDVEEYSPMPRRDIYNDAGY